MPTWKSLISRIMIPLMSLITARYCARTAINAEAYIKSVIPNQSLPDSWPRFGLVDLKQLYETLGNKGLEMYKEYILYRLPSQILVLSIIYPILRDISLYLSDCEIRLDRLSGKNASRFYPTGYLYVLTWPFLAADILQTILLLLSIRTFDKHQLIFALLGDSAGKLAMLKNLSLVLIINVLPVAVFVSLFRIILIGWKTGEILRGFGLQAHHNHKEKVNRNVNDDGKDASKNQSSHKAPQKVKHNLKKNI